MKRRMGCLPFSRGSFGSLGSLPRLGPGWDSRRSTDKWYGVTYREDKPLVVEAIARKTAEGQYPENLWA